MVMSDDGYACISASLARIKITGWGRVTQQLILYYFCRHMVCKSIEIHVNGIVDFPGHSYSSSYVRANSLLLRTQPAIALREIVFVHSYNPSLT